MLKSLILLVAVTACLAVPVAEPPKVEVKPAPARQLSTQPLSPDQKPEGDLNTDSSYWWGYSPYTYYYTRPRYYSYYTPYYQNSHYQSYYYW